MAGNSINNPPRILFYGSLLPIEVEKVKSLFEIFIPELLDQGFIIITREGSSCDNECQVWLDNIILDIAISHRTKAKLDYLSVISYVSVDDHEPSLHDRRMIRLSGHGRLQLYSQLLDKCDVIALVGGREGVYRISLFAHALNKLIIPFTIAKGSAKDVASEIANEMLQLPETINLISSSVFTISNADCRKAVSDIKKLIIQKRTNSTLKKIDHDLDDSINLSELFNLIGKMKLSVFATVITVIMTLAIGCFELGMFMAGLKK